MDRIAAVYNVVWWWSGSRKLGSWKPAAIGYGSGADECLDRLRRAGYVAHRGHTSMGPPEGSPTDGEFRALGL